MIAGRKRDQDGANLGILVGSRGEAEEIEGERRKFVRIFTIGRDHWIVGQFFSPHVYYSAELECSFL